MGEQIQYLVQIKAELSDIEIYFRLDHSSENCLTRTKKDKTSPDRKSLNLIRLKRLFSHVQILANSPKSLKDTVTVKRRPEIPYNRLATRVVTSIGTDMEFILFMGVLETIAEATEIVTMGLNQCEKFSYVIMNSLAQ